MANDTKAAFLGQISVGEVITALTTLGVSFLGTDIEVKTPSTRPKTVTVNKLACPILYRNNENFSEYGFINIAFNNTTRNIFYHYSSRFVLNPEDIERNLDRGLPEFNQPITTLSLGMDPDAVALLTQVARYLGGYIDEDDCDASYYHKVL